MKWRIIPKVSYVNYRKIYGNSIGTKSFDRWLWIGRMRSGRLRYITVKHHSLCFDFRRNWVADLMQDK